MSYFGKHDMEHPRWCDPDRSWPGLVYRRWLPGDPEWTFPRHAQPEQLALTAQERPICE
jgi:hypothetical protein